MTPCYAKALSIPSSAEKHGDFGLLMGDGKAMPGAYKAVGWKMKLWATRTKEGTKGQL